MDERQGRLRARVLEVGEVAAELRRGEHSLVDDGAGRAARDDRIGTALELEPPANHVELALEGVLVGRDGVAGCDEELPDHRCGSTRGCADEGPVDRHVAPADEALALLLDEADEMLLELAAPSRVDRKEAHRDAVASGLRQRLVENGAEERVGQLEQDAGAVSRVRIGTRCAPVLQVLERLQRAFDRLVLRGRVEPRDERDTARIVLVVGGVEARLRRARRAHRAVPFAGMAHRRPRCPWVRAHVISPAYRCRVRARTSSMLQRLKQRREERRRPDP